MSIIIDIILVVIILALVIVAAKKGFMLTLLEVAAFVIAIILSSQLCKPVANVMYTGLFEPSVVKNLTETLSKETASSTYADKANGIIDSLPDFAKNYVENSNMDTDSIISKLVTGNYTGESAAKTINENIARPIAVSILSAILFLVLSLLLMFLLKLVARWLNKLFKLPIIGTANKALGAVFGLLKGIVVVYLVCVILAFMSERVGYPQFADAVNNSAIVSFSQSFSPVEILKY